MFKNTNILMEILITVSFYANVWKNNINMKHTYSITTFNDCSSIDFMWLIYLNKQITKLLLYSIPDTISAGKDRSKASDHAQKLQARFVHFSAVDMRKAKKQRTNGNLRYKDWKKENNTHSLVEFLGKSKCWLFIFQEKNVMWK